MNILKHGTKDNKNKKTFTCGKCGCRFEAAQDEYWTDTSSIWNENITYNAVTTKKSITCCPECHKICTLSEDNTINALNTTLCAN